MDGNEASPLTLVARSCAWLASVAGVAIAALLLAPGMTAVAGAAHGKRRAPTVTQGLSVAPAWAAGEKIQFIPSPRAADALPTQPLSADGAHAALAGAETAPEELEYHPEAEGKGVEHEPKLYVIFWGSNFTTTTAGRETRAMVENLYAHLSGSEYQGILTQYFDTKAHVSATVAATFTVDASVSAPVSVGKAAIREEAERMREARGWPEEQENDQFIVVAAPSSTYETGFEPATGEGFCAYHGLDNAGLAYAFVPYEGQEPFIAAGCIESDGSENAVHETSRFAAAAYADNATDARLNAWKTPAGREIDYGEAAKPCAKELDLELADGAWAQNLFDDHLLGCEHKDASPPSVYAVTRTAEAITPTEATLTGVVNPENLATSYSFQYGPTISYGKTSKIGTLAAGVTTKLVKEKISALETESTYHFRIVAENSTGITYGYDEAVTTLRAEPPFAETEPASELEEAAATINGVVNPKKLATKYHFEWGPSTAYADKSKEASAGSGTGNVLESLALTGLEPATEYHFRIFAKSAGGQEYGLDRVFKTHGWLDQHGLSSELYRMYGMACPAANSCVALGATPSTGTNGEPERGYSETWNGSAWTREAEAVPTGAEAVILTMISCWTPNQCIGVGHILPTAFGGFLATVSERWNGTSWTYQGALDVRSEEAYTEKGWKEVDPGLGMSCTSETTCTVVGTESVGKEGETRTSSARVERWNGQAWGIEHPPGATVLNKVSCTSGYACVAVGSNGTEQAIFATPGPSTLWAQQDAFHTEGGSGGSAISCVSSTSCVAVDSGLAVRESAGVWTAPETLPPPARGTTWDSSVDCLSATLCYAAGGIRDSGSGEELWLSYRWNGSKWAMLAPVTGAPRYIVEYNKVPYYKEAQVSGLSCWLGAGGEPNCEGVGAVRAEGYKEEVVAAHYE